MALYRGEIPQLVSASLTAEALACEIRYFCAGNLTEVQICIADEKKDVRLSRQRSTVSRGSYEIRIRKKMRHS